MSKSSKKNAVKAKTIPANNESNVTDIEVENTGTEIGESIVETTNAEIEKTDTSLEVNATDIDTGSPEDPTVKNKPKTPKVNRLELDAIGFTMIVTDGKAPKLSPKNNGVIFYEIAINDDEQKLYLRMTGNVGGGLHTKEWISLDGLFTELDKQVDTVFKSAAFKPSTQGSSANNASFLAGVLRCKELGLLIQSGSSQFLHVLSDDYQANKAKLLALKPEA